MAKKFPVLKMLLSIFKYSVYYLKYKIFFSDKSSACLLAYTFKIYVVNRVKIIL